MTESDNTGLNNRLHQRVQFFRLRTEDGFIPIFAFAPPDDAAAIAAVVLDLSEGGVQILCSAQDFEQTSLYACTLVDTDPGQGQAPESWVVKRVWTREDGMYLKSGFSFSVQSPVTPLLRAQLEHAQHHVLRCVLRPLRQVA